MRAPEAVFGKVDIGEAARTVTGQSLDKLPQMLMDRCLSGSVEVLAAAVESRFAVGCRVAHETISMPRKGFSPRPVTLLGADARCLYSALVSEISRDLPHRSSADWVHHENFGLESGSVGSTTVDSSYIVEFDIASCYEYVVHDTLRDELLLRSMNSCVASSVVDLPGEVYPSGRGLPQLSAVSDMLGDAYLEIVERTLLRSGLAVSRFADDFKAVVDDWGLATRVIETAAEVARPLGLVLSTEKTGIRKVATVRQRREAREQFIEKYFNTVRAELTQFTLTKIGYDDFEIESIEPDEYEAYAAALKKILEDWYSGAHGTEDVSMHVAELGRCLHGLPHDSERLADELLVEIVFRHPLHLREVVHYLMERKDEIELNWTTLASLCLMGRQSPWSKVWLSHLASQLPAVEADDPHRIQVVDWARSQLKDSHETVRAEAAWFLGLIGAISEDDVAHCARTICDRGRVAIP
jgi:hypothetical protein